MHSRGLEEAEPQGVGRKEAKEEKPESMKGRKCGDPWMVSAALSP